MDYYVALLQFKLLADSSKSLSFALGKPKDILIRRPCNIKMPSSASRSADLLSSTFKNVSAASEIDRRLICIEAGVGHLKVNSPN